MHAAGQVAFPPPIAATPGVAAPPTVGAGSRVAWGSAQLVSSSFVNLWGGAFGGIAHHRRTGWGLFIHRRPARWPSWVMIERERMPLAPVASSGGRPVHDVGSSPASSPPNVLGSAGTPAAPLPAFKIPPSKGDRIDPRLRDFRVMPLIPPLLAPELDPLTGELLPLGEVQRRASLKGAVAPSSTDSLAIRAAMNPLRRAPGAKHVYRSLPRRPEGGKEEDGRELVRHMTRLGITKTMLAHALGIDPSAITRYTGGKVALPAGILEILQQAPEEEGQAVIRKLERFRDRMIIRFNQAHPFRMQEQALEKELARLGFTSREALVFRPRFRGRRDVGAVLEEVRRCQDRACAERVLSRLKRRSDAATLGHAFRDWPLNRRLREATERLQARSAGERVVAVVAARLGVVEGTLRHWMRGENPVPSKYEEGVRAIERATTVADIGVPPSGQRPAHREGPRQRLPLDRAGQELVHHLQEEHRMLIRAYGTRCLLRARLFSPDNLADMIASVHGAVAVAVAGRQFDTNDMKPWLKRTIAKIVGKMYGQITGLTGRQLEQARFVKRMAKELGRSPTVEDIKKRYPDTPDATIKKYLEAYHRYTRALGDESYYDEPYHEER